MRRGRAHRVWLAVCAIALGNGLAAVACNGIVGVEDVRLRKDSGSRSDVVDEEPVIDEDAAPFDSGPPPGPKISDALPSSCDFHAVI